MNTSVEVRQAQTDELTRLTKAFSDAQAELKRVEALRTEAWARFRWLNDREHYEGAGRAMDAWKHVSLEMLAAIEVVAERWEALVAYGRQRWGSGHV